MIMCTDIQIAGFASPPPPHPEKPGTQHRTKLLRLPTNFRLPLRYRNRANAPIVVTHNNLFPLKPPGIELQLAPDPTSSPVCRRLHVRTLLYMVQGDRLRRNNNSGLS